MTDKILRGKIEDVLDDYVDIHSKITLDKATDRIIELINSETKEAYRAGQIFELEQESIRLGRKPLYIKERIAELKGQGTFKKSLKIGDKS